ncbi:SurA N-terminal domain-containing protein [Sphingosinicellaceae bacterium]|nr:SurA N-terminal domain-containing protein [Sphingosinicellaceae bacterium]
MLAFIRKWLTSWPVLVLLGLVLIAFVITGVGDPFGRGGGAGGDLATVGHAGVSEKAVLGRLERVVAQARAENPGLTQAQAAREGGVEQITDQLAGVTAMDEFAKAHGIVASDRAVDGAVASIDAFRVGGKFDQATYQRLLSQQRLSERELKDGLRSDLVRKQLLLSVSGNAQVPREIALPYTRLLLDLHEGAGANVPPPVVTAPTAAQVAAYYAANKAKFVASERRGFRYAPIDREALVAKVAVTDAEVQADYDKNREAYGAVEQRRLSQLVLPDEAKAKAFAAAVAGGESFAAAAAKANGASATDIALGELSRDKFALAASKPFADQVFAAATGSVLGPVKTDFGWNVVKVEAVIKPQGKSFADLRGIITAKLRDAKAEAAMSDLVGKIEDGLSGGKSFADVVKENGLVPVSVAPVGKDGSGATLLPAALPVVAKAFDADPADGPTVVDLGRGQFAVLELGQTVSPTTPPLAQIEPQVTAALTLDLRAKAAQRIADDIVAQVAKGTSFVAAASAHGITAQPIKGRRIDAIQQQKIPPAISVFLTMPAGATRALPATDGTVLLLHVDRVEPGNVASAPPLLEATRQQLAQGAPDELAAAFGRSVEREVGVKFNPAAIAATRRRLLGDATAK